MSDSNWKSPTTIVAIAGLAISIVANVVQFTSAQNSAENSRRELILAEAKWKKERKKLSIEVDDLRSKIAARSADRAKFLKELEQVNKDITIWNQSVFKDTSELKFMEAELQTHEKNGKEFLADASRKNIQLQNNMIAEKNGYKNELIVRRKQIEEQLSNLN